MGHDMNTYSVLLKVELSWPSLVVRCGELEQEDSHGNAKAGGMVQEHA